MRHLVALGLNASQAIQLLTHNAVGLAQSDTGVLDGLFDASDRPEKRNVILWWNDMEKDARYARWSPSLSSVRTPAVTPQILFLFQ